MSRTVIGHSRIFPCRIGNAGSGCFDRGCAISQPFLWLCRSVLAPSLSPFLCCTTTCAGKWIFTIHIPKAGGPREGKPPRTKFTALLPPQLATYKVTNLQYRCAMPARAPRVPHEWDLANVQHRRSCTFPARDLNSVRLSGEPVWMLDPSRPISRISISAFRSHPQSDVYRRRGFPASNWIGDFVRTRLEPLQERDYLIVRKPLINTYILTGARYAYQ